jgi:broad specificity phosphatase PhoE
MNTKPPVNIETVKVNIYGMRHGDKNGDALTKEGREQVAMSCVKNFGGIPLHGYYSSLRKRGFETADLAMANTRPAFHLMKIRRRAAFDYCLAPGITDTKAVTEGEKAYRKEHNIEKETIGTWGKGAPAWTDFLRGRVYQGLKDVATEQAFDAEGNVTRNVFIGSHSPTIELAVTDPNFPRLREADMVYYQFIAVKTNGEITSVSLEAVSFIDRGF